MTTTKHMVEGVAVHSSGAGPAVVVLHANGGNHRDFDAVVERVAATHTVHAIDWPGWGDSPVEGDPTALGYAALLPRVLHGLGGGPFVLIGNSVGGFAAIRTAASHPELVRGLVLVDPGGFTPRWPGTIAACRMIGSARLSGLAMRALPRLYLRRDTAHVAAIRERATIMSTEAERVRTFASIWRSFGERGHNARIDAARLTVPTLLVWGTRDPVLPWLVDGRRARRALPHAQVVTFPCGHQAFAEMPDEFVEAMMPFLHTIAAVDAPT